MPDDSIERESARSVPPVVSVLLDRLTAVRNRLLDRGEYDAHGADVVDATTIGEAIEELRQLRALAETQRLGPMEG